MHYVTRNYCLQNLFFFEVRSHMLFQHLKDCHRSWTNFSMQDNGMVPYKSLQAKEELKAVVPMSSALQTTQLTYIYMKKIALFCIWKYEKLAIHIYLHAYLQMRTTFKTTKALESFHTTITYPLSINTKKLNIMMLNFRMIFKYQPPVPFDTKICKSILNTPTV